MSIQKATGRCECGAVLGYVPTVSPWEFDWRCERGHRGTVSWAHASPPPAYGGPVQPDLFEGAS